MNSYEQMIFDKKIIFIEKVIDCLEEDEFLDDYLKFKTLNYYYEAGKIHNKIVLEKFRSIVEDLTARILEYLDVELNY